MPSAPRSVFDYLKPKDKERLQNMASGNVSTEPRASASSSKVEDPGHQLPLPGAARVPRLDTQVAKMALKGFQPFDTEPVKHARYTAFLNAQAAGEDAVPFGLLPNQTEDEFAKELSDYAKSAMIFKPMSASMAGRFTSSSVVEVGPKAVEGLHKPTFGNDLSNKPDDEVSTKEEVKELSAKENAAKLGMFGSMTREVKAWIPAKLLCKRFGVKEPVVETKDDPVASSAPSTANASSATKELLSITDGASVVSGVGSGITTDIGQSNPKPGRRDIANIGMGEDETQGRDILTYEKPAMDIFKAIFASDDEDSDLEEDGDIDKTTVHDQPPTTQHQAENVDEPSPSIATNNTTLPTGDMEVDLSVFKPTFVPRSDRSKGKEREKLDGADLKGKPKKKKKDKGKSTLMSFDVDMDGGHEHPKAQSGEANGEEREKKKKKKKREEKPQEEDEESMWVEKPTPDAVRDMATKMSLADSSQLHSDNLAPSRGRKRAIDFM